MKHPFEALWLNEQVVSAVKERGFTEPTEIQAKAIPFLLESDKNLFGQASTGTWKTAAFGLPVLNEIKTGEGTKALILLPTRELAKQVWEELTKFGKYLNIKVTTIYGGQSIREEMSSLRKKPEIVVWTPWRVFDHIDRKRLIVTELDYFILDEADEMLNMGFKEDIEEIYERTNEDKKILLFSATMPKRILEMTRKIMGKFETIKVAPTATNKGHIEHLYNEVSFREKATALNRIISVIDGFYGIIFCNTKRDVDEVTNNLVMNGYKAESLHGDIQQSNRERILNKFKKKGIDILVATDVAGRGIDIWDLKYVINYGFPNDMDSYVHRSGRTWRAGNSGTCINLVSRSEFPSLQRVKRFAKINFEKGTIPTLSEIKDKKKAEIIEKIYETKVHGLEEEANALMEKFGEKEAIQRLLTFIVNNEIKTEVKFGNDNRGEGRGERGERRERSTFGTRLFLKRGRKDGVGVKDIIGLIKGKVRIDDRKIKDIKIKDRYSFFSIPSELSDDLVAKLGSRMVEVAKDDRGGNR